MRSAPRYHPRLRRAIRKLDDRNVPIAETCRRVGEFAERIGLKRPSYVHVRRLVLADRERADAAKELRAEVQEALILGVRFDVYDVAERAQEIRRRQ